MKNHIPWKHDLHLQSLLLLLSFGIFYLIWVLVTGIGVPCPFRHITGWKCPGCGITTLIVNLVQFRFRDAYYANPFLFVTGPFLLAEVIYNFLLCQKRKKSPKWNRICLVLYAIALCIFGLMRNLL